MNNKSSLIEYFCSLKHGYHLALLLHFCSIFSTVSMKIRDWTSFCLWLNSLHLHIVHDLCAIVCFAGSAGPRKEFSGERFNTFDWRIVESVARCRERISLEKVQREEDAADRQTNVIRWRGTKSNKLPLITLVFCDLPTNNRGRTVPVTKDFPPVGLSMLFTCQFSYFVLSFRATSLDT